MKDPPSEMRKNEDKAGGCTHLRQEISEVEGGRQWQAISGPTDQIKGHLETLQGIIWGVSIHRRSGVLMCS